eukprot:jgi/Orpsp1_1/1180386/evm.model.c7180000073172.2
MVKMILIIIIDERNDNDSDSKMDLESDKSDAFTVSSNDLDIEDLSSDGLSSLDLSSLNDMNLDELSSDGFSINNEFDNITSDKNKNSKSMNKTNGILNHQLVEKFDKENIGNNTLNKDNEFNFTNITQDINKYEIITIDSSDKSSVGDINKFENDDINKFENDNINGVTNISTDQFEYSYITNVQRNKSKDIEFNEFEIPLNKSSINYINKDNSEITESSNKEEILKFNCDNYENQHKNIMKENENISNIYKPLEQKNYQYNKNDNILNINNKNLTNNINNYAREITPNNIKNDSVHNEKKNPSVIDEYSVEQNEVSLNNINFYTPSNFDNIGNKKYTNNKENENNDIKNYTQKQYSKNNNNEYLSNSLIKKQISLNTDGSSTLNTNFENYLYNNNKDIIETPEIIEKGINGNQDFNSIITPETKIKNKLITQNNHIYSYDDKTIDRIITPSYKETPFEKSNVSYDKTTPFIKSLSFDKVTPMDKITTPIIFNNSSISEKQLNSAFTSQTFESVNNIQNSVSVNKRKSNSNNNILKKYQSLKKKIKDQNNNIIDDKIYNNDENNEKDNINHHNNIDNSLNCQTNDVNDKDNDKMLNDEFKYKRDLNIKRIDEMISSCFDIINQKNSIDAASEKSISSSSSENNESPKNNINNNNVINIKENVVLNENNIENKKQIESDSESVIYFGSFFESEVSSVDAPYPTLIPSPKENLSNIKTKIDLGISP